MSLGERMIELLAKAGFHLLRVMVLYLPDWAMARFLRAVERLAYAISGNPEIRASVAEMADIFESGPWYTTIVRKMFKEGESEIVGSAIKSLFKSSPYGAI